MPSFLLQVVADDITNNQAPTGTNSHPTTVHCILCTKQTAVVQEFVCHMTKCTMLFTFIAICKFDAIMEYGVAAVYWRIFQE